MCLIGKQQFRLLLPALLFVLLFFFPSALPANDLSTLSSSQLSQLLDQKSRDYETISQDLSLTWEQRLEAFEMLQTELIPLWDSLETIKKDSNSSLMMVNSLETKLTTLSSKVDGVIQSLKSIEDDMKQAKNRATWAIVGTSVLAVVVIAGGSYLVWKVNQ